MIFRSMIHFPVTIALTIECDECKRKEVLYSTKVSFGYELPIPDLPIGWSAINESSWKQTVLCGDHHVQIQEKYNDE